MFGMVLSLYKEECFMLCKVWALLRIKKTKKCATIVGETMGKYHPHGDSSIYGSLVYMGQPWSMRHVLIDKQGNFGSEDGDSPRGNALYRG